MRVSWFVSIAIAALAATLMTCSEAGDAPLGEAASPVVYGVDNRQDIYAYDGDPAFATNAPQWAVALVDAGDLDMSDPNNVQINAPTLQGWQNTCPNERFNDQITGAFCSGTLIDDNLVLTAGHCVSSCNGVSFLFNYTMDGANTLHTITTDDVFSCTAVLVRQVSNSDYAIVRLDRPATPRFQPAPVRTSSGSVGNGTPLVMAGFPTGLPLKIDDGGSVRNARASQQDYFVGTPDAFGGNSGSGVFDALTGLLVGVLVRGDTDYVYDSSNDCYHVNVCSENGCTGEDSTYAFRATDALCASYTSNRLCNTGPYCGDGNCDTGESTVDCPQDCGSVCGDGACNGGEDLGGCPEDCTVCGDGVCTTGYEDTGTCADDCTVCDDGICAGEETYLSCTEDCSCGDAFCDDSEAVDGSCCADCGCPLGQQCGANGCELTGGDGSSCAGPLLIDVTPGAFSVNDSTSGAPDSADPSCTSSNASDLVYGLSVAEPVAMDAQVYGYDTVLYLRSSCADAGSELACNDDSNPPGGYGSRLGLTLFPGVYYLFVDGYSSSSGSYQLDFDFTASTICSDATVIAPSGTQSFSGNTNSADNDFSPPTSCTSSSAPDDLYVLTLSGPADVSAEVSGYDTVLYATSNCGEPLDVVACNDDATPPGGLGSALDLSLDAGTWYFVVDGYSSSSGSYDLDVTVTPQVPDCIDDSDCDDGLYCNGAETCGVGGACQSGTPVACDDGGSCTVDTCNESTDSCDNTPNDGLCDDGLYCNGVETCSAGGQCAAGTPVDCDDGVACTVDSCDEGADACDNTPDHAQCDDGQFCDGAGTCDPVNGCQIVPVDCDDGVSCTVDSCDEVADACVNEADDNQCDDGLYCNGVDYCDPQSGCEVDPVDCSDGVSCTIDSCNEATDSCDHVTDDAACDDGAVCNGVESCDPVSDCQPGTPEPPTTSCDDGDACTDPDTCNGAGACTGVSICLNPRLLFSIKGTSATLPGGVQVADEDIAAFDLGTGGYELFFDGSDVGLSSADISSFELNAAGDIVISFTGSLSIPGLVGGPGGGSNVDDSDLVRFVPTALGPATAGTFYFYFDGSDVGLSRNAEDIDATALLGDGSLLISTTGNVSVPGASGRDEDLLHFVPSSLGATTQGSWSLYLDGSDVGLSSSSEDIDAVWVDDEGDIYLSTTGNFSVPGVSGADDDVLRFTPASLGNNTSGSFSLFFDGSAEGIGGRDLAGIYVE